MSIKSAVTSITGLVGVTPNLVFIDTNDTTATVVGLGYLNHAVQDGLITGLNNNDMALVNTTTGPIWLNVHISGVSPNLNYSLVAPPAAGIVPGPFIVGGNIQAGIPGFAGAFISYPPTANNGTFTFEATNSPGNFNGIFTNAPLGQNTTFSVPDPGAATANVLLDTGAANIITDYQQMIPIDQMMLAAAGGAFTLTRLAQGNWAQVHTVAADTSILGFDITEQLRAAAGHGFELRSFDVIYSIGTLAMVAHTVTLNTVVYANNVAVAVTTPATTGALATATQANPYVTNVTVNAPVFNNPAANTAVKQVIEVTANNAATTVYDFYGINLRFAKTIS